VDTVGTINILADRRTTTSQDLTEILDPTSLQKSTTVHSSIAARTFVSHLPISKSHSRSRLISPDKKSNNLQSAQSHPISPDKTTISRKRQTTLQEINSISHQQDFVAMIKANRAFCSKTSLDPYYASTLDTLPKEPLSHTLSKTDTIMEEEQVPTIREGMKDGYTSSPMSDLCLELNREPPDGPSIFAAASMITTKSGLEAYKIEDRGISCLLNIPRFKLTSEFNKDLHITIFKLQDILKRAADLIPERETYFKIDPQGIFFKVLRGAQDLGQLHAAWTALRKRVEISLKTFEKYDAQYQTFFKS
jgi:hypothetical protein